MDILHENLEELCERFGPEQWEVEYSVSEDGIGGISLYLGSVICPLHVLYVH
jgi:hypothetical protein